MMHGLLSCDISVQSSFGPYRLLIGDEGSLCVMCACIMLVSFGGGMKTFWWKFSVNKFFLVI